MITYRVLLHVAAFALLTGQLHAQRVPAVPLSPPNGQLAHKFTHVGSVRELSDGRVIVTDMREQRIVVADFQRGAIVDLARRGDGPTEFNTMSLLYPVGRDSTIHVATAGWIVFSGARISGSWSREQIPATPDAVNKPPLAFYGVQRVVRQQISTTRERLALQDTFHIVSYGRRAGTTDTLATTIRRSPRFYIKGPSVSDGGGGGAGAPNRQQQPLGMLWVHEEDLAIAFPDGWVAIARFDPYRVDWCTPDSRCTTGPTIQSRPEYTTGEKRVFANSYKTSILWPDDVNSVRGWPPTVPPFLNMVRLTTLDNALRAMPDGKLLIERVPTAARPANTYDVIDRNGARVATISLPQSQRIVGFGAKSVYTITTDADDLQHLHRHPW